MLQKPTVLIVDDSPMMCRFLGLFLEKKFDVLSYTDSFEALVLIESGFSPDLIVSDLDMPGMNGIELLEAIKKTLPQVPVIIVSGTKESSRRIKSLELGADDFLMKPFHPAELDLRIAKLVQKPTIQVQKPNRVRNIFGELMKTAAML